jgi:RND family efflux transporter MFP subunit
VIVLDADAQRRLGVQIAPPIRGALAPTRSVLASVEAPPDQLAVVAAPVAGRVLGLAGGLARPGARVRRGELLATLVPTPSAPELTTRAAADLSRAQADVDAARLQRDRTRTLLAEGAVAERRVVDAERELSVAEAALDAARRGSALAGSARGGRGGSGWRVVAPINGVIDEVFVTDGVSIAAHAPIVRIVGERERWIAAEVPEAWIASLPERPSATFRIGTAEPIALPADALVHVAHVVDPRRRTLTVRWSSLASPPLRVGRSGQVELASGAPVDGVIVPRSALLDLDGRTIVIVQVADDEFLDRDVRVATRSGDRLLVTEGLTPDDRVVIAGATLVHLAAGGGGEVHDAHVH